MNDEKIITDITTIHCTLDEHGRRLTKLETVTAEIQTLTLSVEKLALTMQTMLTEQQKIGARLDLLEGVPAERSKDVRKAVVTALIGGIVGAFLTKVLTLII